MGLASGGRGLTRDSDAREEQKVKRDQRRCHGLRLGYGTEAREVKELIPMHAGTKRH